MEVAFPLRHNGSLSHNTHTITISVWHPDTCIHSQTVKYKHFYHPRSPPFSSLSLSLSHTLPQSVYTKHLLLYVVMLGGVRVEAAPSKDNWAIVKSPYQSEWCTRFTCLELFIKSRSCPSYASFPNTIPLSEVNLFGNSTFKKGNLMKCPWKKRTKK